MAKTVCKYIDLFSGLGGIRIGLEQALQEMGLEGECVFTAEIKDSAITAHNHNFNDSVKQTDITAVKSEDIPKFNILLGGFPCQAFSYAGKQRGFSDTRGTLFFDVARILKSQLKNVDGFLLENVEGLITHDRVDKAKPIGRTLETILDVLTTELGFNVTYAVLDASDFGVAQARKRVYIVGCKAKYGVVNLLFHNPVHATVGSCLEKDLPLLDNDFTKKLLSHFNVSELHGKYIKDKRGGDSNIHSWDFDFKGPVSKEQKDLLNSLFRHRRRKNWADVIGIDWMDGMPLTTEQIRTFYDHENLQAMLDDLTEKKYLVFEHPKKKVVHETENGTYSERVPDEKLPKGYNIVSGKLTFEFSHILNESSVSPTIVAMDMSTLGVVDNNGLRHLSYKEGLRLFGYPEWYSLDCFDQTSKGSKAVYDLLGNSVCVPVIKQVCLKLLSTIYGKTE